MVLRVLITQAYTDNNGRFSILWWIELVLRVVTVIRAIQEVVPFQYPLVDRVGFEGQVRSQHTQEIDEVSVSSGGSSWF